MKLPEPGDVVAGKYVLDQIVGEGGFGVVYRATTISSGRPVAIKLLKPGDGGAAITRSARFIRELRASGQLASPHTVTVYDHGQTDDGALFMVCEFVPGIDLAEVIRRRGVLTEPEAFHIIWQVAMSLDEAHRTGLLHRDIKPSNIMVFEYAGDPLRVKVLDFGLAKSLSDDERNLTATGKVIGTPRYMSPEQLLGERLTPASDIFSLGVVAFELLCGRPALLRAVGELSIATGPGVTPPLAELVNRMLAREVANRYQSTARLLEDMRALKRPAPATAPTPSATPFAPGPLRPSAVSAPTEPRLSKRSRAVFAAILAVVFIGVVAAVLLKRSQKSAAPPEPLRESPAALVAAEPDTSDPQWEPEPDLGKEVPPPCTPPYTGAGMLAARGRLKKFPVLIPSDYGTEPRPLVIIARNSWSIWYGEARLTGSLDEFYQITQKHEQTLTEALAKSALERGFVVVEAKLSATEGNSDSPLVAPVADALMRPVDAAVDHLCIDETRVFAVGIGRAATSLMDASCSVELNAYATLTTPLYGKRGPVPLSTFTTCDHLPRLDVAMPRITERLDRFGPIWSFFDQPDPRAGAPKPLADGRRMLSLTPKPLAKLERK